MGRRPKSANASDSPANPRKSTGLSARKCNLSVTRRSERIRNLSPPPRNQDIEAVAEDIILCDSEKEEEEVPHVEEPPSEELDDEELPFEELNENASLEEKVDYLLRTVKKLMSEAGKKHAQDGGQSAELNYRGLYFDSHKKIEALTEENRELSKKLDVALAQVKAFGEVSNVCTEVLGKLKDTILVSSLAKANEVVMNLSSQTVLHKCSSVPLDTSEPPVAGDECHAPPESRKRKKSAK